MNDQGNQNLSLKELLVQIHKEYFFNNLGIVFELSIDHLALAMEGMNTAQVLIEPDGEVVCLGH